MRISKDLNNSLAILSNDNVSYFILVYIVRVYKDDLTLRFLGPNVMNGLVQEYQVFDLIGDNSICQKSTGLVFKLHSFEEVDYLVDMDEDIRYLDKLTTKDKILKINKIKEGDDLVYREYDIVTESYSIPERCKIKKVDKNNNTIEFFSHYSKSNKTTEYECIGKSVIKYFVKI